MIAARINVTSIIRTPNICHVTLPLLYVLNGEDILTIIQIREATVNGGNSNSYIFCIKTSYKYFILASLYITGNK